MYILPDVYIPKRSWPNFIVNGIVRFQRLVRAGNAEKYSKSGEHLPIIPFHRICIILFAAAVIGVVPYAIK